MTSVIKTSSYQTVEVSVPSYVSISYASYYKIGKFVHLNFGFNVSTSSTATSGDLEIMQMKSAYDYPKVRVNTSCIEAWGADKTGIVYAEPDTGEIRVVIDTVNKGKLYFVNLIFLTNWGG